MNSRNDPRVSHRSLAATSLGRLRLARIGFSLLDLLVAIGIIAALIALLIPSVLNSLEAARARVPNEFASFRWQFTDTKAPGDIFRPESSDSAL